MTNSWKHSIRDPAGRLHVMGSNLFRQVYAEYAEVYRGLLESTFIRELQDSGDLVQTALFHEEPYRPSADDAAEGHVKLPAIGNGDILLTHKKIPFVSFPAEWPPEMLHAAGQLTLKLSEQALAHGFCLKDATPYNVLFDGPKPVFIDFLSFEPHEPNDPLWFAQAQFIRTFLLPLLVNTELRLPLSSLFLTKRDGIEPSQVYHMLNPVKRLMPPFVTRVALPVWLSAKAENSAGSIYRKRTLKNSLQANYILLAQFGSLRRDMERALGKKSKLTGSWSDYNDTCTYDEHSFANKDVFVEQFLMNGKPRRVLDVGCNTGHFSVLAARHGAEVVSIDQDPAVIGALWKEASSENLSILPLVVDFARPTPALGWNNAEYPSFLDRSRGYFDAIFMLAVMHHLVVNDQIPLDEIMDLASRVTSRYLIIEYVAPDDPQFKRIARGRDSLYQHMTSDFFELTATNYFRILGKREIGNHHRTLYILEKSRHVK